MMQIDHNKNERRPTNRLWWALWGFMIVLWGGFATLIGFDWPQILLGMGTGAVLAAWATDLTGNKFMG